MVLDEEKLGIERERLELDRKRLALDSGFAVRNSGALIGASVSIAVLVASAVQFHLGAVAQENLETARLASEQERNSIESQDIQNNWNIGIARFVFDHEDLIIGTPEDQKKFVKLAKIAWGPGLTDPILQRLQAISGASHDEWSTAISQLDSIVPKIEGDWECTVVCQDRTTQPRIARDGWSLTITNEVGGVTSGRILEINLLIATDWQGLTAQISSNFDKLLWGNGSVWERKM